MTKTTLSESLAYECGLTKKESKTIVDTVFRLLTDALIRGEDVTITDFASFRIKDRPSRVYRNSVSGELMEIRPGKRVKVKMSEKVMKAIDPESNVEN
jgi:nucleoid DNA-binding protein